MILSVQNYCLPRQTSSWVVAPSCNTGRNRYCKVHSVWISLRPPTSFLYWFISILLLFAVLLLCLPVPAGTCAHSDIERAAAQYETPGGGRGGAGWDGVRGRGSIVQRRRQQQDSLCSLQREDGEDGPPVHPSHAWAVAHELQQDGAALRAQLKHTGNRFTLQILDFIVLYDISLLFSHLCIVVLKREVCELLIYIYFYSTVLHVESRNNKHLVVLLISWALVIDF